MRGLMEPAVRRQASRFCSLAGSSKTSAKRRINREDCATRCAMTWLRHQRCSVLRLPAPILPRTYPGSLLQQARQPRSAPSSGDGDGARLILNGRAVAFDSQARKRLELSSNTIAKSRSDGIGAAWRLACQGEVNVIAPRFRRTYGARAPGARAPGYQMPRLRRFVPATGPRSQRQGSHVYRPSHSRTLSSSLVQTRSITPISSVLWTWCW
jgi:hypothetical protein